MSAQRWHPPVCGTTVTKEPGVTLAFSDSCPALAACPHHGPPRPAPPSTPPTAPPAHQMHAPALAQTPAPCPPATHPPVPSDRTTASRGSGSTSARGGAPRSLQSILMAKSMAPCRNERRRCREPERVQAAGGEPGGGVVKSGACKGGGAPRFLQSKGEQARTGVGAASSWPQASTSAAHHEQQAPHEVRQHHRKRCTGRAAGGQGGGLNGGGPGRHRAAPAQQAAGRRRQRQRAATALTCRRALPAGEDFVEVGVGGALPHPRVVHLGCIGGGNGRRGRVLCYWHKVQVQVQHVFPCATVWKLRINHSYHSVHSSHHDHATHPSFPLSLTNSASAPPAGRLLRLATRKRWRP